MKKHIFWNRSVFYSLLVLGIFPIVFVCLAGSKANIALYKAIISVIVGVILGLSISLIERFIFKGKPDEKYQPTKTPSMLLTFLLCFSAVKNPLQVWSFLALGGYIFTLGVAFRRYEKSIGEKGIIWSELLTK